MKIIKKGVVKDIEDKKLVAKYLLAGWKPYVEKQEAPKQFKMNTESEEKNNNEQI